MLILSGKEFYTRQEVQEVLKLSKQTLIEWMNDGKPPKVYRLGGRVYYLKSEVEGLMQEVSHGISEGQEDMD